MARVEPTYYNESRWNVPPAWIQQDPNELLQANNLIVFPPSTRVLLLSKASLLFNVEAEELRPLGNGPINAVPLILNWILKTRPQPPRSSIKTTGRIINSAMD